MVWLKTANLAESTLLADITNTATELSVQAGHGTKFPADNFEVVVTLPDHSNWEVMLCTSRSTDTLTVTRYAGAVAHAAGELVELRVTKKYITELQDAQDTHAGLTTGVHGVGAYNVAKDLVSISLAKAYLGTNQPVVLGTNPRVELDTKAFDLGSNFQIGDWYGAAGAYRQAGADSDANNIKDATANFPAALYGALVKTASDAAGTLNTGVHYVGPNSTSTNLPIIKQSGVNFAASYYYWIQKRHYLAPVTGYYPCFFQEQYLSGVEADKRYGVYIYVNGVFTIAALFHASVAGMMRLPHNGVLFLTAGDIVSMHGYTDAIAAPTMGNGIGNKVMSIFCLALAT